MRYYTTMTRTVVVDSDAIFALYNPNDPLNTQATKALERLITQGYQLIYPASVLFEIVSLFQRVLPTPAVTARLVSMIKNDTLLVHAIDADILRQSAVLFDPAGSKKHTLVDCSVVVVARKIKADGVFAYDNFYTKQGLKLAEELIEVTK